MKKMKLTTVEDLCLEKGLEFIDKKYANKSFQHEFKCLKHNKVYKSSTESIEKGCYLDCCNPMNKMKFRKHTIKEVRETCTENGFDFMDDEYGGINKKHYFKCLEHREIHKSTYKNIKRGRGIHCCKRIKIVEKLRLSEDYVASKLQELKFKLIDNYKGLKNRHLIKCLSHNRIQVSTLDHILNKKKGLQCCKSEKLRARPRRIHKKHRVAKTRDWKEEVKKKDDFICQICNKKKLDSKECVAHRVNENKKIANEISNGKCLCFNCSSEFHKVYGFSDNTKEQFKEFSFSAYKKQREKPGRIMKLNPKRARRAA